MDQIFVILGWIVMASLALAIARQLSEQKIIGFLPNELEGFINEGEVRDPATLLKQTGTDLGKLTAQTCYEADFISKTNVGGDYKQRTNNFKHGNPDNCSAPFTEFVNSIYK